MAVALTIQVSGFDYGFDFEDQRIDIDEELEFVDVGELWAAIKNAQDDEVAMPYGQIATGSGLDQLSPGISTFLTVSLLDMWEINSLRTSGRFTVGGGNLIRVDSADPFRDNPLITYQLNLSQAGVVAVANNDQATLTTIVSNTEMARKVAQNRQETDRNTGKLTIYEDDSTTPFIEGDIFEDAAGTQPYRGAGIERRERLE